MIFYSCFKDLKVVHSKGTAVFKKGIYETNDKVIINELKKDKNIRYKNSIEEIALGEHKTIKENK